MQESLERWLPVVGWEGLYEVSDLGRVRCLPRKWVPQTRLLKTVHSPGKYPQVGLFKPGRKLTQMVHQLVAKAFLGPCPSGMEVCHFDGNRANNAVSNLRYDTRKANHADKRRHGTLMVGEDAPSARLCTSDVLAIRSSGRRPSELAEEYGVTVGNIYAILSRRSWRHV